MQFTGARGTFGQKIWLPQKVSPRNCATFLRFPSGRPDPQGWEIAKYWLLGHFGRGQPPALRGIPGGNRKTQFPSAGGSFGGRNPAAPKVPPRNYDFFLRLTFLADRAPRGRELRNTGVYGHSGLGQPSALGEILGEKRENTTPRVQLFF